MSSFIAVAFCATFLFALVVYFYLKDRARLFFKTKSFYGNIPILKPNKIDRSYLLIAPFNSNKSLLDPGKVYLSDLVGTPLHVWDTPLQPYCVKLHPNGNLLVEYVTLTDMFSEKGTACMIHEIDWNGRVVWEYKHNLLHHDFAVLPNDQIAVMLGEFIPDDLRKKIRGGIDFTALYKTAPFSYGDHLAIIDKNRGVVWEWHAFKHIDVEAFELDALSSRNEWTHGNSIEYVASNPLTGTEAFLVSFRNLNTVMFIEISTGNILWQSPKGMMSYQHDARMLPSGNVLVFDNGLFRADRKPSVWSRVLEIDPKTNKVVWEFKGAEGRFERARFAVSIMGGAQRLSNGNTFIVDALKGYFIEVTPEKEIVWDFVSQFFALSTGPWKNNTVFKVYRYRPDEIDFPVKLPPPIPRRAIWYKWLLEKAW